VKAAREAAEAKAKTAKQRVGQRSPRPWSFSRSPSRLPASSARSRCSLWRSVVGFYVISGGGALVCTPR